MSERNLGRHLMNVGRENADQKVARAIGHSLAVDRTQQDSRAETIKIERDGTSVTLDLKPRPGSPLQTYSLPSATPQGAFSLHLEADAGLEVGDLLLIDAGSGREEIAQIIGFGSVHVAAALRFAHPAGARVH